MKALGSLIRDGWVIGIACGAGLAYTTIRLLDETLAVVFAIADGIPAAAYEETGPLDIFSDVAYSATINGHLIFLEPLLRAASLFVVAVGVSAVALYTTRSPEDDAS